MRLLFTILLIALLVTEGGIGTQAAPTKHPMTVSRCLAATKKVVGARELVKKVSELYSLPHKALPAVVQIESAWDSFALSTIRSGPNKGKQIPGYSARGLGQVMPDTVARLLGEKDISDSRLKEIDRWLVDDRTNLCWTGKIFRVNLEMCQGMDSEDLVLACASASYYRGPDTGTYIMRFFSKMPREDVSDNQ